MSSDSVPHFSLDLGEMPVELSFSGKTEVYVIRELDVDTREVYLNELSEKVKTNADGSTGLKSFRGLQAALLSRCLYDSQGALVPLATIQKWPSRAVSSLFDLAKVLCSLDDQAEGRAKKN